MRYAYFESHSSQRPAVGRKENEAFTSSVEIGDSSQRVVFRVPIQSNSYKYVQLVAKSRDSELTNLAISSGCPPPAPWQEPSKTASEYFYLVQ
jgi:hypothetical protein